MIIKLLLVRSYMTSYDVCLYADIMGRIDDNPFDLGDEALRKAYKGFPDTVRQVHSLEVPVLIYKSSTVPVIFMRPCTVSY